MERLAPSDRRLVWDACLNVRDLGGITCGETTIARGRLVRASIIGSLSAAGRAAIRAHGIRSVVDLRTEEEVAADPSPYRAGLAYRHAPFAALRIMGLHRAALDGTLPDELRRIAGPDMGLGVAVIAIAESEPGVVLHCLAGRDRTGIVIATLLAAIGVPDEEIVADYVASDVELAEDYTRFRAANPDRAADIDDAIARRAWVMSEVLAALRSMFGGGAPYLRIAGVLPEQVEAIRAMLLA